MKKDSNITEVKENTTTISFVELNVNCWFVTWFQLTFWLVDTKDSWTLYEGTTHVMTARGADINNAIAKAVVTLTTKYPVDNSVLNEWQVIAQSKGKTLQGRKKRESKVKDDLNSQFGKSAIPHLSIDNQDVNK